LNHKGTDRRSETVASVSGTAVVFHLLPPAQPVLSSSEVVECAVKPHITTVTVSVCGRKHTELWRLLLEGGIIWCVENMCSALKCMVHSHVEVAVHHKNPDRVDLLVLMVDGFYSIP